MKEGDILLYLDSDIKITDGSLLLQGIEHVKSDYIISSTTQREDKYTKMDLLRRFDMDKPEYISKPQHQAGLILLYVCDKTRRLLDEWYNVGCDYHMIDDTPSNFKNHSCFIEHRHDQSIFSLLTKKYSLYSECQLTQYGIGL